MSNESIDRDSSLRTSMSVGNILIILIFSLSLILDWYPIWVAIISSIIIWILFANILNVIAAKWKEKATLIEKGESLHQFCDDCGLRFSSEKSQCPKCGTIHN